MIAGIGSFGNSSLSQQIARSNANLQTQLGQISSGKRLASAAVDPAALGVFVNLDTAAASTRMGVRNANSGLSMLQTADSAAGSITDSLQRMRELAMQASSGTLNAQQRTDVDAEFQQLREEVGRQAQATEFAGQALMDGSASSLDVQVGTDGSATSEVGIGVSDLSDTGLGIGGLSLATQGGAQGALDTLDAALDQVGSERARIGASYNRLESSIRFGESSARQSEAAASRIMDADFAVAVSEAAGAALQSKASVAALAQSRSVQRTAVVGLLG